MSDEGKDDVDRIQPDTEGKIPADKEGKYPEVVPYHKYVGVKEMLTRKEGEFSKTETELKGQVTSLEERLKNATSADDVQKIRGELEETKTKLQTSDDELKGIKEKSAAEKREILTKRGVSEEKVKGMSVEQLDVAVGVLAEVKPGADMGSGGGSGDLADMSPKDRVAEADRRQRTVNK